MESETRRERREKRGKSGRNERDREGDEGQIEKDCEMGGKRYKTDCGVRMKNAEMRTKWGIDADCRCTQWTGDESH